MTCGLWHIAAERKELKEVLGMVLMFIRSCLYHVNCKYLAAGRTKDNSGIRYLLHICRHGLPCSMDIICFGMAATTDSGSSHATIVIAAPY